MDSYELLWVGVGQWMQQGSVHYAEDRRCSSNAQGNRQNRNDRESGRMAQHAQPVTNVARKMVHPSPVTRLIETFLGPRYVAKRPAGSGVGFLLAQPLFAQSFRFQLYVGFDFSAIVARLPLASKHD